MGVIKWSDEALIADAARFSTRYEWSSGSRGAYSAAQRRGLLEVCCAGMRQVQTSWSDEDLINDASRFETRNEWRLNSSRAYKVAWQRNLLDVCCAAMRNRFTWTTEALIEDASRYATRADWRLNSGGAYSVAKSRGLLEACCAGMRQLRTDWTDEDLIEDASRFTTRADWRRDSPNAYPAALRRNLLDVCCAGMQRAAGGSDNDAIYIWRAIGETFNGEQIYKIGVTSARLGTHRIEEVCQRGNMQAEIIILAQVAGRASQLELQLLEIGTNPGFSSFNGSSEFRAMSDEQLKQALALIAQAAQETIDEESNVASEQE